MKKIVSGFLAALFIINISIAQSNFSIIWNNKQIENNVEFINNKAYIPVRTVLENLGYVVNYQSETSTIEIKNNNKYRVIKIVDGDTIDINFHGINERIRLIGVNTPEMDTQEGKKAKEYTSNKLMNKEITFELDKGQRDSYGRLLAYIYIDGLMFNKMLLQDKIATIMTIKPNTKYESEFQKLISK